MVAVPGAREAPVILGTGIGMSMPKMAEGYERWPTATELPSYQEKSPLDRSPGSQCCSALDATRSSLVRRVSHALLCQATTRH